MRHDGPVEPGTKMGGVDMNPTKATPSQMKRLDDGVVEILDERPGFKRVRFRGRFMKGTFTLIATDEDRRQWQLTRGAEAPRAVAADWRLATGKDPSVDRKALRPFASLDPMKPRGTAYTDAEVAIKEVGTPGNLELGLAVEPKWNGFRIIAQGDGKGKVRVSTEDGDRDISKNLPSFTKDLQRIKVPFIIDGEGQEFRNGDPVPRRDLARFRGTKPVDDGDFVLVTFQILFAGNEQYVDAPYETQRRRLIQFVKRWGLKQVRVTPGKVAHTVGDLRKAVRWASRVDGSEGAMLKMLGSTYSLGGHSSSWWKIRLTRLVRAIVDRREGVEGAKGVWNYYCGLGPVKDKEQWRETVEVGGKHYSYVGRTFNTSIDAKPGDVLQVRTSELLVDMRKEGDWSVTWYLPSVDEIVEGKPMTPGDVADMAFPDEVKKDDVQEALFEHALTADRQVVKAELLKADDDEEERFVLGIVLEPNDGDDGAPLAPDTQGDIYSREDVRRAAHGFMEKYRGLGLEHKDRLLDTQAVILESYLAPGDFEVGGQKVREGSWLLGERIIDDRLWKRIKDGDLKAYSIGGNAIRTPEKT
jgi:hypothetical protein